MLWHVGVSTQVTYVCEHSAHSKAPRARLVQGSQQLELVCRCRGACAVPVHRCRNRRIVLIVCKRGGRMGHGAVRLTCSDPAAVSKPLTSMQQRCSLA